MLREFKTLKFQISIAVMAIAALFVVSSFHTLSMLSTQRQEDNLLRLGTRLQIIADQMNMRAMNYLANAARDYDSYFRDLKLYYGDLKLQIAEIERLTQGFAHGRFGAEESGMEKPWSATMNDHSRETASRLLEFWTQFRNRFEERIGSDENEPRLEWAAAHVTNRSAQLNSHINELIVSLETAIAARHKLTNRLNRAAIVSSMVVAAGILFWFVFRVLRPLQITVQGFRNIAAGDFTHRVTIGTDDEIGRLASSVNRLAARLDALVQMLTRLQEGSNLDETLKFTAETMPRLVPLDWVGIVFVSSDNMAQLESAYCDGQPDTYRLRPFAIDSTPLGSSLVDNKPTRIHDLSGLAASDRRYRLLRYLAEHGMRDSIFMPVNNRSPIPGVLVFATRTANTYTSEHIELLTNISLLLTLSFARTLKLTEHTRLAAIGQFASGIAHELRSPLTTLSLALEYFERACTEESGRKRADLAIHETKRMNRLLDEMLLYAKPLQIQPTHINLATYLQRLVDEHVGSIQSKAQRITWSIEADPTVSVDADRLRQVVINLLDNAMDASPADSAVSIAVQHQAATNTAAFSIRNFGGVIGSDQIAHIFEPFYTTKPQGTGLGLGIVRRIVDAHGGTIEITSEEPHGTTVTVTLPLNEISPEYGEKLPDDTI